MCVSSSLVKYESYRSMERAQTSNNSLIQSFDSLVSLNEGNICLEDEQHDQNQVTPQHTIDCLSHYTIKPNGAYLKVDCTCGICYSKYNVGDKAVRLPCQHNFHEHCIENWLKWVKSTCPVDKKSVDRSQYMKDLVNERRILLEAHALNNIIARNRSEENVSSDDERYILDYDNNKDRKTLAKKERCYQMREEIELSGFPKLLSPLHSKEHTKSGTELDKSVASTGHAESNTKLGKPVITNASSSQTAWSEKHDTRPHENSLEKNEENRDAVVPSRRYPQQVRDSVDVIRKSIHAKESNVKKLKNSKKFQKDLDTVVANISNIRIKSPVGISRTLYKSSRNFERCLSPSKSREANDHVSLRGIMGKRSLTFGDMVESENEVNFCWIYKGNKEVTLPGRYSKKY